MSAQNLKMQKGVGAFVVAGSELSPDGSPIGSPYPSSAGEIDFVVRSTPEQDLLSGANRPSTPQHDSTHPTVAFIYSTWT